MKALDKTIIVFFVLLYIAISVFSTIHVYDFFLLSNPHYISVGLSIAFELGQLIVLCALVRIMYFNAPIIWMLFILLTGMQIMGNTYYSFINLENYQGWIDLFGLNDQDDINQRRIISLIQGGVLPIIALGFAKALVNYLKVKDENAGIKKQEESKPQSNNNEIKDEFDYNESEVEKEDENQLQSNEIKPVPDKPESKPSKQPEPPKPPEGRVLKEGEIPKPPKFDTNKKNNEKAENEKSEEEVKEDNQELDEDDNKENEKSEEEVKEDNQELDEYFENYTEDDYVENQNNQQNNSTSKNRTVVFQNNNES